MLWFLWSRDRINDLPQGTYSHQTALSLYDLSDINPAKLHMTVPKRFRRNSAIPKVLVLHKADLEAADSEDIFGVRATTPLRTISDLIAEGKTDRTILKQALCGEGRPIRGRAEHVRSGDEIRFENLDELQDFLVRSLARERHQDDLEEC